MPLVRPQAAADTIDAVANLQTEMLWRGRSKEVIH
jgi:hypothetical protein